MCLLEQIFYVFAREAKTYFLKSRKTANVFKSDQDSFTKSSQISEVSGAPYVLIQTALSAYIFPPVKRFFYKPFGG